MKHENEPRHSAPKLAQPEISGAKADDNQAPILADRRRFLIVSMLGAAGLAASPLHRALALPGESFGWTRESLLTPSFKIRWRSFLGAIETVTMLFGFGPLAQTITELVGAFLPNNHEQQTALSELGNNNHVLDVLNYIYHVGANSAEGTEPLSILSKLATNMPVAQRPKQFMLPSLKNDGLNGIMSYFDYGAGTLKAVGQLVGPTNHLIGFLPDPLKKIGYATADHIRQALYPYRQSRASMGGYDTTYGDPDLFKTTQQAVVEVQYNNLSPGKGEGEVALFHLEDKVSNKIIDGIQRFRYKLDYHRDESE